MYTLSIYTIYLHIKYFKYIALCVSIIIDVYIYIIYIYIYICIIHAHKHLRSNLQDVPPEGPVYELHLPDGTDAGRTAASRRCGASATGGTWRPIGLRSWGRSWEDGDWTSKNGVIDMEMLYVIMISSMLDVYTINIHYVTIKISKRGDLQIYNRLSCG